MLIDAHCHLSGLAPEELEEVLDRARAAGVARFLAIGAGYGLEDNAKTLAIANTHDDVYCALAVHPHDAKLVTDENFADLAGLIRDNAKVRAVGEIGLDYHYMNSDKDEQQDVFRRFIRLAREVKKPVVIHDRDCGDECPRILAEEGAAEVGGMVHCFSGTMGLAERYLELGFYVSFTGIITFKKADDLRDVVKRVPLDRLLIETDSPFLAPIPHRGKKNEPAFVRLVAECVARTKGMDLAEVAKTTWENAERLLGL
jgi:TatD DNase family protein